MQLACLLAATCVWSLVPDGHRPTVRRRDCSEAVSASPELVGDHDQLYTGSWTELPNLTVARLFVTTQSRVSSPMIDSVLCPDTDLEVP